MKHPKIQLIHIIKQSNGKIVKNNYKLVVGETDYSCGDVIHDLTKEDLLFIRNEIDRQLIKL